MAVPYAAIGFLAAPTIHYPEFTIRHSAVDSGKTPFLLFVLRFLRGNLCCAEKRWRRGGNPGRTLRRQAGKRGRGVRGILVPVLLPRGPFPDLPSPGRLGFLARGWFNRADVDNHVRRLARAATTFFCHHRVVLVFGNARPCDRLRSSRQPGVRGPLHLLPLNRNRNRRGLDGVEGDLRLEVAQTDWRDCCRFHRALQLAPNNVLALYGLGTHLADIGRVDEGKPYLEKAIRLQPAFPESLAAIASLFDGKGEYTDAIRFYESAIKQDPDFADALNNLAWLRASCPDVAFRDGTQAVRLATRACEITHYEKPLFIGTLAAAQAEARDFQTAITTAERAAALAASLRLDDIVKRNRELIELYRQGKSAAL